MGVDRHQPQLLTHGTIIAQATDDIPHEVPVQQSTPRPPGRYGERSPRGRRATVAASVVLAAAFFGWVLWAALGAASPGVRGEVTAFVAVSDEAIEVRVAVSGGDDDPVGCSVQALGRTREVVGVGDIVLDPSRTGRDEGRITLRTRDRAVSAVIGRCASVTPTE